MILRFATRRALVERITTPRRRPYDGRASDIYVAAPRGHSFGSRDATRAVAISRETANRLKE
jgi:hypothetical protein